MANPILTNYSEYCEFIKLKYILSIANATKNNCRVGWCILIRLLQKLIPKGVGVGKLLNVLVDKDTNPG